MCECQKLIVRLGLCDPPARSCGVSGLASQRAPHQLSLLPMVSADLLFALFLLWSLNTSLVSTGDFQIFRAAPEQPALMFGQAEAQNYPENAGT